MHAGADAFGRGQRSSESQDGGLARPHAVRAVKRGLYLEVAVAVAALQFAVVVIEKPVERYGTVTAAMRDNARVLLSSCSPVRFSCQNCSQAPNNDALDAICKRTITKWHIKRSRK